MSCAVGLSEAPLTVAKCLLVLFVGFPYVLGPESPAAAAAVTAMTCDESSKQARCKAELKVAAGLILVHVFTEGPLKR